ncbi:MAG: hypothetical protein RLZZ546_2103 [Bacteroidota bacterium]|jgi:hypothetical protein
MIQYLQILYNNLAFKWELRFGYNNIIIDSSQPLERFTYTKQKRTKLVVEINNKFEDLNFSLPTVNNQIIS